MLNRTSIILSSDVDQDTYGKVSKLKKSQHTREPRVNPFPTGGHTAERNRQDSITKRTRQHNKEKHNLQKV